jgi:DNA-binding MarR family transcriptional regulator
LPRLSIAFIYVNMADIFKDTALSDPTAAQRQRLITAAELLFFAYRDFTGEPDAVLETFGFGRAHHRVLHFVYRNPGLRVASLLDILKITKQSLARVLKQLIEDGFILQQTGPQDRRERRLFLTPRGRRLAEKLTNLQIKRIAAALDAAGPDAHQTLHRFLLAMISEDERDAVKALTEGDHRQPVRSEA